MNNQIHTPSEDAIVIGDGATFVDFFLHYGDDLKTRTPSIGIIRNGQIKVMLTWDQARQVAQALIELADLGEFG